MTEKNLKKYRLLLDQGAITPEEFTELTGLRPEDSGCAKDDAFTLKQLADYRMQLENGIITAEEYTRITGLEAPKPIEVHHIDPLAFLAKRNLAPFAAIPALLVIVFSRIAALNLREVVPDDRIRWLAAPIVWLLFRWGGVISGIISLVLAIAAFVFYDKRRPNEALSMYHILLLSSLSACAITWCYQIAIWRPN